MKRERRIAGRKERYGARGSATVELAVITPILLTMLFGIIEYGYVFMVRQTLTNAAREGARIAFLQTTDTPYTEVTDRVSEVMAAAGLTGYTVTMTHATSGNNWVETVDVSMSRTDISLLGNFLGVRNGTVSGTCSMRKAGVGAPT